MNEASINTSRFIKRQEDFIWGEVIGNVWKGNVKIDLTMASGIVAIQYSNYFEYFFNAKFLIETIIYLCLFIKCKDFQAEVICYVRSVI